MLNNVASEFDSPTVPVGVKNVSEEKASEGSFRCVGRGQTREAEVDPMIKLIRLGDQFYVDQPTSLYRIQHETHSIRPERHLGLT